MGSLASQNSEWSRICHVIAISIRSASNVKRPLGAMNWEQISRIQKAAFIKSLSFWFVAVPILAKVAQSSEGQRYLSQLSLPFNWGLFYACSLCFFVSNLVYSIRCPTIVKNYNGFGDFKLSDGSFEALRTLSEPVFRESPKNEITEGVARLAGLGHVELGDGKGGILAQPVELRRFLDVTPSERALSDARATSEGGLNEVYGFVRGVATSIRPAARVLISAFNLTGFVFLAAVLYQNVASVWQYYAIGQWLAAVLPKGGA
jgi:hypothetical protein